MSLHAARGGAHEDLSWSALGRRAPRDVIVGDRGGGGGMRRAQQVPAGTVRVDEASSASTFRELDDAFLQKQTKIWLGEVLHLRFDEDVLVADLLADGELLFQVSKVLWRRLLKKNREQLKQSKVYIYERLSFGRSNGKYMPYSKVDSFLKICQILGLAGIDLFTPSDVVEKRNVRKVCICIRSVSKKSQVMRLNVPDFDIVTYTISMPNYIVGGILRSLEQPHHSSSGSSGCSPYDASKALQQQNDEHGDTHYDSDEAESRLSVLEPEDSVDEENFAAVLSQLGDAPKEENEGNGAVLSQLGDAPKEENQGYGAMLTQLGDAAKEENEGYGESGHDMHGEESLAESVGSLNFGIMDSDSVDSTPQCHDKESYSTHSATDQCSRTRTSKCSLSSEESDSISSNLALESGNNDLELNSHHFADLERTSDVHVKSLDHSTHGNGETLAGHPKKECAGTINHHCDSLASAGTIDHHCDALACDMESVCSSCEESRYGLSGEPSDLSSESYSGLTPTHTMGGKLPMVSEDPVNNIEPSMTGMTIDSMSEELNPEFSDGNQMEGSKLVESDYITKCSIPPPMQEGSKFVESDDIPKCSIPPQRPEDDAPKSGKGVLKSVAGGITLVGAVFFMVHLRRSKERSFARVIPSLSGKSIQRNSTAKSMDKENVPDVYPGAQLKV